MEESAKNIAGAAGLGELEELCRNCKRCALAVSRRSVVFGGGSEEAEIFLLGEAPGAKEDEKGRPFVGRSGNLLDSLLAEADLKRCQIFMTGSVKCRPPGNRNPYQKELRACRVYLDRQLELVNPRVVVCLGLVAVKNLLGPKLNLTDLRGRWFAGPGFWIMPTYHPAAALRGSVKPGQIIEDFKKAALKAER